jgi:tetratricopeptide (TPR) repeat protein
MKNIIKIAVAAQILAVSAIHAQTTPSFASFKEAFEAGLTESRVTKNYDQALLNFKAALDLSKTSQEKSDSMMYIALVQFHNKDFENAQIDGEKLLQLEDATPSAVSGVALMMARLAWSNEKDPVKTKTLAEKVISQEANMSHVADAKIMLAHAQDKLDQKPEAIATLQSVIADETTPVEIKEAAQKLLKKIDVKPSES